MNYTHAPLSQPLAIKRGRGRPQALAEAVWNKGRCVAVFQSEGAARAYAARLNKLARS